MRRTRRDLLKWIPVTGAFVASGLSDRFASVAAGTTGSGVDRLEFATALEAAARIREKQVSSLELTQLMFARIDKYHAKLNAFVYQTREEALARARQADEIQARGESLDVLHGVPIHVKESFAVAGRPTTWGIPALKDSKAPENAESLKRLLGAGAVLLGATNVPT